MLHGEISRSNLHSVNWRSTEFSGVFAICPKKLIQKCLPFMTMTAQWPWTTELRLTKEMLSAYTIRYDTIRYESLTWTRKLSIQLYLAHVARKRN